MTTPAFVYVLTVEHRHGTNVSAHASREHAEAALWEYVTDWWVEAFPNEPLPEPADGNFWPHIDRYFEVHGADEWHNIQQCQIEGLPEPGPVASSALMAYASEEWCDDDNVNIDGPALVSEAENGCWIQAWLWVEGWSAEGELEPEGEEADA